MKKSIISMVISCVLLVNYMGGGIAALGDDTYISASIEMDEKENKAVYFEEIPFNGVSTEAISNVGSGTIRRATSRIEWIVSTNTIGKADTAYLLEPDELVTINYTYSPRTAKLDSGFITSDNESHSISGNDGSIRSTIRINDTGKYYFAVRKNTAKSVEVLGYVYY